MKTFYGQLEGMGSTRATKTGSKNSGITASVQHKTMSFTTWFHQSDNGELRVEIYTRNDMGFMGRNIFCGSPDDYITALEMYQKR